MFLTVGISSKESLISLLGVTVMFALVLVLSYVITKWLGGTGFFQQRSKNISIVETYKLGSNQFIQIVRIGKRYYALGVSKDKLACLSEISEEELDLEQYKTLTNRYETPNPESFKDIFSKINRKKDNNSENK